MLRSQMWMPGYDFVYTNCLKTLSEDRDGWCRCDVSWWSDTRTWTRRRSAEVSVGHFGPFITCWDSSAPTQKKVRHFGTKDIIIVPNCLRSEVSWARSVRTPLLIYCFLYRMIDRVWPVTLNTTGRETPYFLLTSGLEHGPWRHAAANKWH